MERGFRILSRGYSAVLRLKFPAQIGDLLPLGSKQLLIPGLNFEEQGMRMGCLNINVVKGVQDIGSDHLEDPTGVAVEKFAVGLQMDFACRPKDPAVPIQKVGVCEPVLGPAMFDLRVGKGDPDFSYLPGGKELVDEFDLSAQEACIGQLFASDDAAPAVDAGPLHIDAQEVLVGKPAGQTHGVVPFATAELQDKGVIIAKKISGPSAAQPEIGQICGMAPNFDVVRVGEVF